ncbi:hypothetical protein [Micromonospora purpureochromogenes]|uniref:hypothetical protein n=1 Tax=Micromonospora purpureochromogenes TaxID=47872 RepID=UPI0012FDC7A0|nr:hypothetical protein [Micromonospora purpureochromogenes]
MAALALAVTPIQRLLVARLAVSAREPLTGTCGTQVTLDGAGWPALPPPGRCGGSGIWWDATVKHLPGHDKVSSPAHCRIDLFKDQGGPQTGRGKFVAGLAGTFVWTGDGPPVTTGGPRCATAA